MAKEKMRGCGYRKINGLYLVGDGIAIGCDRLPYTLDVCPTCSQGIKPTMGFTRMKGAFFKGNCEKKTAECHLYHCKICNSDELDKVGLLWVGSKFYSPESFIKEAKEMGISKRVGHIPKGLKEGDFILLAHREAGTEKIDEKPTKVPAIFYGFHLKRIEKIITKKDSKNPEYMKDLEGRGITPVIVDDDDVDHKGNVYDDIRKRKEQEKQKHG